MTELQTELHEEELSTADMAKAGQPVAPQPPDMAKAGPPMAPRPPDGREAVRPEAKRPEEARPAPNAAAPQKPATRATLFLLILLALIESHAWHHGHGDRGRARPT